jgi:hypothetical protein
MQKRLTEMRSKQDVIDQRAEAEIRKVLTPANRAKFNKMLGADFDLSKLAQAPDFGGGPNGRRGRNQDGGDNPRGNNNANAPRGQNNAPGNDAAPADGNDSDDQKSAPQRPRTRPQPRVRGTN